MNVVNSIMIRYIIPIEQVDEFKKIIQLLICLSIYDIIPQADYDYTKSYIYFISLFIVLKRKYFYKFLNALSVKDEYNRTSRKVYHILSNNKEEVSELVSNQYSSMTFVNGAITMFADDETFQNWQKQSSVSGWSRSNAWIYFGPKTNYIYSVTTVIL